MTRRGEFDTTLADILERVEEIEEKYSETEEQPMRVQERVEAVRVSCYREINEELAAVCMVYVCRPFKSCAHTV